MSLARWMLAVAAVLLGAGLAIGATHDLLIAADTHDPVVDVDSETTPEALAAAELSASK